MINPVFTNKYNEDAFTEFIQGIIPSLSLDKKQSEIRTGFKSIQQIAEVNENKLDLVVFVAKLDSSLHARVEITKNTYAVLKSHARSNALVAYISNDPSEWRLSLITTEVTRTKKGTKESVSNPRRFSYVLGPNAKVATPSKMLQGIINSITDLENKFSLAVVSKEFYTQVATQYSKLVGGTRGEGRKAIVFERTLKLGDTNDAVNANFAIRLIGRLVFCWFLKQKKGHLNKSLIPSEILSVSAVKTIGDYYHSICVPLFFEVLNKPQPSRPAFFSHAELFDKVPFLNGGLFQDHTEDNHKFNRTTGMSERRGVVGVPDIWFSELFQIFEEYNFTIDENTSIDTELSIDPEILGRIFENLLAEVNPETGASARKSTGSFYTPREIVDFMVEESLIAHLRTKTNIPEEKLRALSSYDLDDDVSSPINQQEQKILVAAIHNTTVLDPTCGSGAFPIGVLQRLVHMLEILDPECLIYLNKVPPEIRRQLQKHSLTYVRKLGIIRECIHGVDIQPIAIDISRLRCFLTLIVDQQVDDNAPNRGIEPLPNLDFKFVCANTLIKPPIIDGPLFGDEFATALGELIDEYFAPVDQLHKLETARKLQQLISDKTNKELESIVESYSYLKDEKYKQALAQKNEKSDTERIRINSLWKSYENIFQNKPVGFFDTRYFFPAVYRQGGFDIVIGNPPYVGEKGHKELFQSIAISPLGKRFYQRRMDLFYFFFHIAFDVLKENGIASYITTNYYITATGGTKLIQDIRDRTTILMLYNFGELKIFESALGQHNMISIFQKGKTNRKANTLITNRKGYLGQDVITNIINKQDTETNYFRLSQDQLFSGKNIKLSSGGLDDVLDKIKDNSNTFGNICDISTGIQTSADKITNKHIKKYKDKNYKIGSGVYVLNSNELESKKIDIKDKHIKPWFKNSDINRYYSTPYKDDFVLYFKDLREKQEISNSLLNHFESYKDLLVDRLTVCQKNKFQWDIVSKWIDRGEYYLLFYPRKQKVFEGEKIVAPQRSKTNTFGYNTIPWYASADVYFITQPKENYKLKFLLGILNSKLIYVWLYNRGKRKGEMLELYKEPLSKIPIKKILESDQKPLIEIVDKILAITKSGDYLENPTKKEEVKEYEKQIDQLVYKLYDLEPEEIKIIENSNKK